MSSLRKSASPADGQGVTARGNLAIGEVNSETATLSAQVLSGLEKRAGDHDFASEEGLSGADSHRGGSCSSSVLGMITKVIPAGDPKFRSDRGKKAIADEMGDLLAEKVWRHDTVQEWDQVRGIYKDGFPPMVGLLFLIMGQKQMLSSTAASS